MQLVEPADIQFNPQNTPVSTQFDDVYFSNQDGLAETRYVFLEGNNLWARWLQHKDAHFVIAETGFGTGLNFLVVSALFQQFRADNPSAVLKRLFFISFEKFPLSQPHLAAAHTHYPEFAALATQLQQQWTIPLVAGCYRLHFDDIRLDIWLGDINDNLPQLGDYMQNKIDAWFLDGFAPSKNPQMWREELYRHMYRLTKPQGTFATFTAASAVRKGLENAGFSVRKRKGFGKKRECLHGWKEAFPPQPRCNSSPQCEALEGAKSYNSPNEFGEAKHCLPPTLVLGEGVAERRKGAKIQQKLPHLRIMCRIATEGQSQMR